MRSFRLWKTKMTRRARPSMKRIALIVLCLLLLIIPSVLALVYVYHTDHLQKTDLFSVSLYDTDGVLLGSDQGPSDNLHADSLAGIFHQILTKKKPISLGDAVSVGDPHLHATLQTNGVTEELDCYFSFVASGGYCIDAKGACYSIPAALNEQFLSTTYAEPFYADAMIPKLMTIDNEPVTPSVVHWKYRNYGGVFQSASRNITTAESRQYDMTGEVGILFETEPSTCTVQIFDGDRRIYNGSHQNLASMTFDSGDELQVKVRAVWKQTTDIPFYGEIQYDFSAMIRNRSTFSLNTETVTAGSFALLSCTNISNLSKISFQTDSAIPTPVFHQDGDMVRALIVFPPNTDSTGYSFRVSYGASSKTFTITVTPAAESASITLPSLTNKKKITEQIGQQWNAILQVLPKKEKTGVYFRGNFNDPIMQGFQLGYTHGATVLTAKDDKGFVALGTEYIIDGESERSVSSLMNGIVLQVGYSMLLGNYVVVDHGCGLRTWYGHLSDTDVEIGQVVATGDSIGKTGTSGLASSHGFLLVCTIYDHVISPSELVGKEISLS